MKKLVIMNMREGEEWIIVDGKERRLEKKIVIKDSVEKKDVEPVLKSAKKKVVKEIKEVTKNGKERKA